MSFKNDHLYHTTLQNLTHLTNEGFILPASSSLGYVLKVLKNGWPFHSNWPGINPSYSTPNFRMFPINNHLQLEFLSLTDEKTSFFSFLIFIANFVKTMKKVNFCLLPPPPPQKKKHFLKVYVLHIFTILLFKSKMEHLWNWEKCILFHFKGSFRFRDIQILQFYNPQFPDVIKRLSKK